MKKIIILTIISIILLSGCKKEIIEKPCINVTYLDHDFRLDAGQIPKGTWEEKSCPSGKKVEYIELITTEDSSKWRKALYCDDEYYFWIADFDNSRLGESIAWYGVWEGKPCSLNS